MDKKMIVSVNWVEGKLRNIFLFLNKRTHKISVTDNPLQLHYLELLRHKRELLDRLESVESDGSLQKVGPLPERPKEKRVAFTYDNLPLRNKEAKHVISQKLLICLATVGFTRKFFLL